MTARLRPPRYQRIAVSVRERIDAGEFEEGQLPSIERLCEDYGVGRATVRKSLGILVRDAVVKRRSGHSYEILPVERR